MDEKIKSLKKALNEGNVIIPQGLDMSEVKNVLDDSTMFTHLGSHYTYPGKVEEFIYMVASVKEIFTLDGKKDGVDPKTWGWVATEEEARKAVAMNAGDMNEANYYKYAVIEKLASGIFCIDMEQIAWFEWINDPILPGKQNRYQGKWVEIPQPEWAKNVVGWTL